MTTPAEEAAYFEARARQVGPRRAVWDEPTERWEAGRAHCLARILAPGPPPAGTNVLDLGCGMGRLTDSVALALREHQVVGLDASRLMIQTARRLRRAPNSYFLVGDGRTLPPHVRPLGAAFSVLLFQHLPADAVVGYVEAIADVLVPGGWCCFQWTVGSNDNDFAHDHEPGALLDYCEKAGLTPGDVERDSFYPTWRWLVAR